MTEQQIPAVPAEAPLLELIAEAEARFKDPLVCPFCGGISTQIERQNKITCSNGHIGLFSVGSVGGSCVWSDGRAFKRKGRPNWALAGWVIERTFTFSGKVFEMPQKWHRLSVRDGVYYATESSAHPENLKEALTR